MSVFGSQDCETGTQYSWWSALVSIPVAQKSLPPLPSPPLPSINDLFDLLSLRNYNLKLFLSEPNMWLVTPKNTGFNQLWLRTVALVSMVTNVIKVRIKPVDIIGLSYHFDLHVLQGSSPIRLDAYFLLHQLNIFHNYWILTWLSYNDQCFTPMYNSMRIVIVMAVNINWTTLISHCFGIWLCILSLIYYIIDCRML